MLLMFGLWWPDWCVPFDPITMSFPARHIVICRLEEDPTITRYMMLVNNLE